MKMEIDDKEKTPVYNECPTFDYPCHILNTEQEVFQEGLDMHHCIYTCYWKRIKNKEYLGLSFYPVFVTFKDLKIYLLIING